MSKLIKKFMMVMVTSLGLGTSVYAAEIRETLRDAGVFIEPALTYETSDSTVKYPVVGSSSGEVNGYGLALRAGGHISEAIFLGVDGRYSFPNVSDRGTDIDSDARSYNWGPTLGVQMPNIGLRLWAGYIADGSIDPKGRHVDVKFADAEGYRLGAGFKVYNVSLNLEYADVDYGSAVLERVGPSFAPGTSFQSVKYGNESYTASVSFPMSL